MVESSKSTVQSVGKAFAVLQSFRADTPEMTISEVASAAGLDRGTAFRLIHTMVDLGYLAAVPGTRRFWLTLKCLELGYSALAAGGLQRQSRPVLQGLVPDLADAASLGMLDGADVVYLERIQADLGRQAPDRRTGSRTGAYAAALGHAILAWQPPDQARQIMQSGERIPLSGATLTDLDQLCARLNEVRGRGYAISDGENAFGLRTVAAPIFWPDGTVRAAVSLTVQTARQELDAFVAAAVPPLLQATRTLSGAVRLSAAP
ncbi:MAG: IclR family transcriptional regulator [Janthinobacterium lividum]